jgi:hypothetical protein
LTERTESPQGSKPKNLRHEYCPATYSVEPLVRIVEMAHKIHLQPSLRCLLCDLPIPLHLLLQQSQQQDRVRTDGLVEQ